MTAPTRRTPLPIPSLSPTTLAAAVPTVPITIPPPSLPLRAAPATLNSYTLLLLLDGTPPPATISSEKPVDPGMLASKTFGTCHVHPMAPGSGVRGPTIVRSSLLLGKRVWTGTGVRRPSEPLYSGSWTANTTLPGHAKTPPCCSNSGYKSTSTCGWSGGNDAAGCGSW